MVFEALRGAGLDPGLLTGGDLALLQNQGFKGNAWVGRDWLVIEADESDKSLVHYAPEIGVILNLHRDHYEAAEVLEVFETFRRQVREAVILGSDAALASPPRRADRHVRRRPGRGPPDRGRDSDPGREARSASRESRSTLGIPGRTTSLNAAAALAACRAAGADLARAAAALARFRGVARRFEIVARRDGVEVVDDFAHNPAKVAAALATARERSSRVLAFFQPHGFAPMRFMRAELAAAFAAGQRPQDRLFLPEIFYTGGTAVRDLSSRDLCADVAALGGRATFLRIARRLPRGRARDGRAGRLHPDHGRARSVARRLRALGRGVSASWGHATPGRMIRLVVLRRTIASDLPGYLAGFSRLRRLNVEKRQTATLRRLFHPEALSRAVQGGKRES